MDTEPLNIDGIGNMERVWQSVSRACDGNGDSVIALSALYDALSMIDAHAPLRAMATALICGWLNSDFASTSRLWSVDSEGKIDKTYVLDASVKKIIARLLIS